MKVCAQRDCPELTDAAYCDNHKRQRNRSKARERRASGDPSMDIYSTPEWRRTRARQLRDHPDCAECGAVATTVDHRIPRAQLVARGVDNPDDPIWLQSLCKRDHDRKTATVDGGFGREAVQRC